MSVQAWGVTADVDFLLVGQDGAQAPVPVRLRYDVSDPYAVSAVFHIGPGESVEWTFGRELLAEGTRRRAGPGDVRVEPIGTTLRLSLSSPSGEATLDGPLGPVTAFIARSNTVVPPGHESEMIDIDGELALLLP